MSSLPIPTCCNHCDFHSGQRGMDRCAKCGGTGSQLLAANQRFPNTEQGYKAAIAAIDAAQQESPPCPVE